MTPAQAAIESARADAGMVTTPQAEQQMQRGRDIADALTQQNAYHTWVDSEQGREVTAHMDSLVAAHIAFDAGWEARSNVHPPRETLAERANHDDKLFAQLCADDAEALKAHEDDTYFTRYGL